MLLYRKVGPQKANEWYLEKTKDDREHRKWLFCKSGESIKDAKLHWVNQDGCDGDGHYDYDNVCNDDNDTDDDIYTYGNI